MQAKRIRKSKSGFIVFNYFLNVKYWMTFCFFSFLDLLSIFSMNGNIRGLAMKIELCVIFITIETRTYKNNVYDFENPIFKRTKVIAILLFGEIDIVL
jgi:hypothetical protein